MRLRRASGNGRRRRHLQQHAQQRRDALAHVAPIHDHVENAVLEEKFASLEAFGQRLAHRLLDDSRACEANQGARLGEIQVADVPGRCEPGTGEINYPFIARTLADLGYEGTVAMEAWAAQDSDLALERFRAAFNSAAVPTASHGGLS